jgi:hypothetical protein
VPAGSITGVGFGLGDREGEGVWATTPTALPVKKTRQRRRKYVTEFFIEGKPKRKRKQRENIVQAISMNFKK